MLSLYMRNNQKIKHIVKVEELPKPRSEQEIEERMEVILRAALKEKPKKA